MASCETDVTKTFEKLKVGGGLIAGFFTDKFDLLVVSSDEGVSDRRLLVFCSSKDFSEGECSTPNEKSNDDVSSDQSYLNLDRCHRLEWAVARF